MVDEVWLLVCSVTYGITRGTGSGTLITSCKWNKIERTAATLRPRVPIWKSQSKSDYY